MEEFSELTVSVKGEDSTYKQKFALQGPAYAVSIKDPIVKQCVDEAVSNSKIVPEDISVRILLTVK